MTRGLFLSLCLLAAAAGCASAPRPVPTGGQPVATVEGAGLVLSVPRLDQSAYPDDVLDVAAAVFVAIENRGTTEVQIAIEDFSLSGPDGMSYAAVPPQQLTERAVPRRDRLAQRPSLFTEGAPVYAGPVVPPPAPAYRGGWGGGFRGSVPPPAPAYRGGWGGSWGGPRVWVGPGYGWGAAWWWGPPYGPYWWWGPNVYIRTRDDAIRYALPAGKLPPGGRVAGFLYFPRRPVAEGTSLLLRWQAREAQTRAVIADLRVPLEMNED